MKINKQKNNIRKKYVFNRFVVGNSNRFAFECARIVAKYPGNKFNPLFICGGVGVGKTYLMHAIGNELKCNFPKFKILYVTSEKFTYDFIEAIKNNTVSKFTNKYRNIDCLLIDDIQFLAGKHNSQEEFYNLFNTLKDSDKQIVIASDRPQNKLEIEEKLISRFKWGNTVDIQPPDLETRIAVLKQKVNDENIVISEDIVIYIAKRINNIRELEGTLLRLTAFFKFTKTPFTLDEVKKILKDID